MTHEGKYKGGRKALLKKGLLALPLALCLLYVSLITPGCGVYSFADVSVPDSIKTVRLNFIENRASYVNPQLSPSLTDRLRQKIVNQTRLTQTNSDNAHWDISGVITEYSVSTSAISSGPAAGQNRQQTVTNRLTVGVQIKVFNRLSNTTQDYSVSRSFEFSANLSLQAAENRLLDEIIHNLTDDVFNRIFSNW